MPVSRIGSKPYVPPVVPASNPAPTSHFNFMTESTYEKFGSPIFNRAVANNKKAMDDMNNASKNPGMGDADDDSLTGSGADVDGDI